MTTLTVALIDDEPLARLRLRTLLAQTEPACEVVGEFGESVAALLWLREQDAVGQGPDMILLDIQMPGLDGMVLAARLRELRDPPAIVFVTAHADRAVDAFQGGALDYLLKPYSAERMAQTVDKLLGRGTRGHVALPPVALKPQVPGARIEIVGLHRLS